jgi:hypothetical protein
MEVKQASESWHKKQVGNLDTCIHAALEKADHTQVKHPRFEVCYSVHGATGGERPFLYSNELR